MDKEKRIRILESNPSKPSKSRYKITRMGITFTSSDDALCEFHKNGEKVEIIVRHLSFQNTIDWFLQSREMDSNKFVKKVLFRCDLDLKRAFKLTSTMPSLSKVNFILGRRENGEIIENFNYGDNSFYNSNVKELGVYTDWGFYKFDRNKEITDNLLLSLLKYCKVYYPSVTILDLAIPGLELLIKEAEQLWSTYFPKTEFLYKESSSDGISKFLVYCNSNPTILIDDSESESDSGISTPHESKAQLDCPIVLTLEDLEKSQSFIRPNKRKMS